MSIITGETEKKVHIFIDNSNLFIEGKYAVGQRERLGHINKGRKTFYYDLVRIEHGQLLEVIQSNRKLGSSPFLVGSRPPSNDSVWKYIRKLGFEIKIYDRNCQNREKKVDVALACAIQKTIDKNPPGVLVLVAGDGDYDDPVTEAMDNGWEVEVWFWKSGMKKYFTKTPILPPLKLPITSEDYLQNDSYFVTTSNVLRKTDFRPLDKHYKFFTYGDGCVSNEKAYTLKIIGEELNGWTNKEAMQCFIAFNLFSRLKWENSTTLYLYYKKQTHMELAKRWLEKTTIWRWYMHGCQN